MSEIGEKARERYRAEREQRMREKGKNQATALVLILVIIVVAAGAGLAWTLISPRLTPTLVCKFTKSDVLLKPGQATARNVGLDSYSILFEFTVTNRAKCPVRAEAWRIVKVVVMFTDRTNQSFTDLTGGFSRADLILAGETATLELGLTAPKQPLRVNFTIEVKFVELQEFIPLTATLEVVGRR